MKHQTVFGKGDALAVMIAALAWLAAVFPVGVVGYLAPGLISAGLAFTVVLYGRPDIRLGSVLVFGVALLGSIFYTATTGDEGIWIYRDYLRLIFLVAFMVAFDDRHRPMMATTIGVLLFASLLFDFFVLLGGAIPALSALWYSFAVNSQFQEYIDAYYRHLGLLGSPNLSAAYYLLAVYAIVYLVPLPKVVVYSGSILGFALLLASQSRSHLIAVTIAILIAYRGIRATALQILLILVGIFGALDYLEVLDVFVDRLEELSAFEERLYISRELFANASIGELFFGSPHLPSVVDNDVTFFVLRFGIILFAVTVLIVGSSAFATARKGGRASVGLIVGVLVSSLAGGVMGHPGLMMLAVIIFQVCVGPRQDAPQARPAELQSQRG